MSYKVRGKSGDVILNESDIVSSVLQNISVILSTKQGTVPMYREFGLPMNFVDKPIPVARTIMVEEITEAIERFEPRATVLGITFDTDEMTGKIVPIVEVDINDEQTN